MSAGSMRAAYTTSDGDISVSRWCTSSQSWVVLRRSSDDRRALPWYMALFTIIWADELMLASLVDHEE